MKTHTSPGLAIPSSPSEQSILPLSGAVSGGHVTTGINVGYHFQIKLAIIQNL